MKAEDQQTYNKQYYDANKQRIIKQIVERQKLIRNSDKYIEDNREKLINDLNNGTRKFVHYKTLLKYKINVDPKSLNYYYNSEARTPSETTTEGEEEQGQEQPQHEQEQEQEQQQEEQEQQQEGQQQSQHEQQQEEQQHEQEQEQEQPQQEQQQEQEQPQQEQEQEQEAEAEEEGNITIDTLKAILEQNEISENDKNKIITYPQQKKNKRKKKLIKQIREWFKF